VIMNKQLLRELVLSKYLDLFGAALILGVCIYRDFLGTTFENGEINFGVSLSELPQHVRAGAFPLGLVSTIGAVFSLLSTRLVGKQNNWGNIIGVITTITSGSIDYMFGNHSAVITYPVTFMIHNFSVFNWAKGVNIRKRDLLYYLIMGGGILIGFILVYLGAYLFGGISEHGFLITVSLIFGLSLGANYCNALKYEETWLSWIVYNVLQLLKNIRQLNLANIAKYIFYLFNAFITLFDWKLNGDRD